MTKEEIIKLSEEIKGWSEDLFFGDLEKTKLVCSGIQEQVNSVFDKKVDLTIKLEDIRRKYAFEDVNCERSNRLKQNQKLLEKLSKKINKLVENERSL